jgi:hypothetical protein
MNALQLTLSVLVPGQVPLEFGWGLFTGVVAALVEAQGLSYDQAVRVAANALPDGFDPEAIPDYWRDGVVRIAQVRAAQQARFTTRPSRCGREL